MLLDALLLRIVMPSAFQEASRYVTTPLQRPSNRTPHHVQLTHVQSDNSVSPLDFTRDLPAAQMESVIPFLTLSPLSPKIDTFRQRGVTGCDRKRQGATSGLSRERDFASRQPTPLLQIPEKGSQPARPAPPATRLFDHTTASCLRQDLSRYSSTLSKYTLLLVLYS